MAAAAHTPVRLGPSRTCALAFALAVLIASAAIWHVFATSLYARSFMPQVPLADRASAASIAGRLEPWNARYTTRAMVMTGWLRGERLLEAGDYNAAVDVLAVAYRLDVGDQELLLLFREAQEVQSLKTVGKAHIQHGHDAPGERGSIRGDSFDSSATTLAP